MKKQKVFATRAPQEGVKAGLRVLDFQLNKISMGESNTVVSIYTLYGNLQ